MRFKLRYTYQNGQMQKIHDFTGDTQTTKFWEAISTNARGAVIDEEFGNGLKTFSKYDHIAGWLDYRQSAPGGGNTTQHLNYAWDKVGNLTERKDENQVITEGFTYDALDRLATTTGVSSLTMGYDGKGNITSKSDVGSYNYTAAQSGCSYYSHTQPHAVRNAGGTVYCYDANGNMASRAGASISWTSYNLPSQINQTGGNSSQFWYGANRQRYKQVSVSGSTTTTTIYAGRLLQKVTIGSVTDHKHYVRAVGQTVAIHIRSSTSTNSTYYPLKDHLGSIDRLTNSSGSVVVALSYDAFGKRRGSNWTGSPSSGDLSNIAATTRHGFTEHEHLDNLTLVHMNGRVYDPAIGRFSSADPLVQSLRQPQSLNRFSYAWNGPLRYTDPSGFENSAFPNLPIETVVTTAKRGPNFDSAWIRQLAQNLLRDMQRATLVVAGRGPSGGDVGADPESDGGDDEEGDDGDEEDEEQGESECGDSDGAAGANTRGTYVSNVIDNVVDTNTAVPGILAPTGLGVLTSGATSEAFFGTRTATFGRWLLSGFAPIQTGWGAAVGAHTMLESGVLVGATALMNVAMTGLSYEAGVLGGSLVSAIPNGAGGTVRDSVADAFFELLGPDVRPPELACGW